RQGQEAADQGQRVARAAPPAGHAGHPAHAAEPHDVGHDDEDGDLGGQLEGCQSHAGGGQDVLGQRADTEGQGQASQGRGQGGKGRGRQARGAKVGRGGRASTGGATRTRPPHGDGVLRDGRELGRGRGGARQQADARGVVDGHGGRPARLREALPPRELLPDGHDQDSVRSHRPDQGGCARGRVQAAGRHRHLWLGACWVHGRRTLGVDRRTQSV
ncbi:unnamed protein product, partial [Prorocentrum cordatum]